jgi:LPS export ABC transporter protein LptC
MIVGVTFTALLIGISEPTIKVTFDPELKEITDLRPDAFMEGIYQRQFDQNGGVKTTLAATSLLDFGRRSNAELIDPRLWLNRAEGTWFIEADFGVLTADRNQLHLKKNVIVNRLDYGKAPWELTGDTLNWDQSTDLITSDGSTVLSQGSAESIGKKLVLDINTSEYSLGHKVRMQWRSITLSD